MAAGNSLLVFIANNIIILSLLEIAHIIKFRSPWSYRRCSCNDNSLLPSREHCPISFNSDGLDGERGRNRIRETTHFQLDRGARMVVPRQNSVRLRNQQFARFPQPICYDCGSCSTSFVCGSEPLLAASARAETCSWRTRPFGNNSRR
jgi:hypothetical protein